MPFGRRRRISVLEPIYPDTNTHGAFARSALALAPVHIRIKGLQELHCQVIEALVECDARPDGKSMILRGVLKPAARRTLWLQIVFQRTQEANEAAQVPEHVSPLCTAQ